MDKFYAGSVETCDWCHALFTSEVGEKMYDAKSQIGPWGNFCSKCFKDCTRGQLGTGYGQEYTRQADDKWLKTGG